MAHQGLEHPAAENLPWAIGIAVFASLIFACIEIPIKAKAELRSCCVPQSLFYWGVLAFGNTVTTILASLAVAKMPAVLTPYYHLLSAFFGVFAFEAILKNTNVTMFDKGVLTLQTWIDKALNAATAAAIDRQETRKWHEESRLVRKLSALPERDINTHVLRKMGAGRVSALDAEAASSSADTKLYKIYQFVKSLSDTERRSMLVGRN